MEEVLNSTEYPHAHPEILATYLDAALRGRKGTTSLTEAQIEDAVERVVQVFPMLAVSVRGSVCVGSGVGWGD
jgi:hypothetical protein